MKSVQPIPSKIFSLEGLKAEVSRWRFKSEKIVFTNGVFDMLHEGHISSLCEAALHGHMLVVAVNSDASVKRLKGNSRPIQNENARALILASLLMTDAVIIFDEDTPLNLIKEILPDVLVKGGDYSIEQIAGAKEVMDNGGSVVRASMLDGISTTAIIERLKKSGA